MLVTRGKTKIGIRSRKAGEYFRGKTKIGNFVLLAISGLLETQVHMICFNGLMFSFTFLPVVIGVCFVFVGSRRCWAHCRDLLSLSHSLRFWLGSSHVELLNNARRFALFHSALLVPTLEKVIVVLVKPMKNPMTALIKTSEVNEESKDCSDQDLNHGRLQLISSMPLVTVRSTPPPLMHLTNWCVSNRVVLLLNFDHHINSLDCMMGFCNCCNCCWRPHNTRRLFVKKQTRH
ncbi:uncharacterized protein LOC133717623 [Rosa rugosa]|uniref:uncharacterized protein LOC133717623 n=1 Tax=Rosa rugosa TaxID=74645 RepID=UPI002B40D232|nr:uncharacterized protein LOC133717623 [Rosa rugosa]